MTRNIEAPAADEELLTRPLSAYTKDELLSLLDYAERENASSEYIATILHEINNKPVNVTVTITQKQIQALQFWVNKDADFALNPHANDCDEFLLLLHNALPK